MRPLRISAEGFVSHRKKSVLDLEGVDFFSLSGPTGSGKSSLVDAMIFALYGRIPRLGAREVEPVISSGAERARVSFEFEVEGTSYTAVRVAQRNAKGGASVKEARLETGSGNVASGAEQVTTAVEELLGLRFEDFNRTVVLPQGEFAFFLTAPGAKKQGLLRAVLGLDIYQEVGRLAKERAAAANAVAERVRSELAALDVPGDATRDAALDRAATLESLLDEVKRSESALLLEEEEVAARLEAVVELERSIALLEALDAPQGLEERSRLTVEARERVAEAETSRSMAEAGLADLEARRASMPSADQMSLLFKSRDRLQEIDALLASDEVAKAEAALVAARSATSDAVAARMEAESKLELARSTHAAHALRASLREGEPCPVCQVPVSSIPEAGEAAELGALESALARARAKEADAIEHEGSAKSAHAAVAAGMGHLRIERDRIAEDLAGSPHSSDLPGVSARLEALMGNLKAAEAERDATLRLLAQARQTLEDLTAAEQSMRRDLTAAQLSVAALGPPVSESDDVIVQWKELVAWRHSKLDELGEDLVSAAASLDSSREKESESRRLVVEALESAEIPVSAPYSSAVEAEARSARATVDAHKEAADRKVRLEADLAAGEARAGVAKALAGHMGAAGFERWLMAGALTGLVDGANDLIRAHAMLDERYTLRSDDKGTFSVVDHHEAGEARSVSTLSGGETFVLSLALALSLAEAVSAAGGMRLETIILDEGFGSLSDEPLDTIAGVLDELAGRGLMVGVITHVKELSALAPVRFDISQGAAGSKVEVVK